jgi:hypothetical protein
MRMGLLLLGLAEESGLLVLGGDCGLVSAGLRANVRINDNPSERKQAIRR